MATANPPDTPSADESVFDAMREQIIAVFDRIMGEVRSSRDQLLSEVDEKRREFELKNSAVIESMRELEEMRSQLEKMSVKHNLAMKKQQESLTEIDSEIDKLRTDIHKNTQLKYSCSLDQLITQVRQFGEIIDEASNRTLTNSNYCHKLTAVRMFELCESDVYNSSIKLYIDSYKELLYVAHSGVLTVLVYNANDFTFLRELGHTKYYPRCVTASKEFIYVLSTNNSLLQYRSSDFSFVKVIESSIFSVFDAYTGIAASEDSRVFVFAVSGSILVYDRGLNFKEQIKLDLSTLNLSWLSSFKFLGILMKENRIYILLTASSNILFSVLLGNENTISCYFKKGQGKIPNVENPSAFIIDSVGNIIVADSATNSIKFLSPEGDLIHTIGEVANCSDIAVHKNSIIVGCKDLKTKHHNVRVF